MSNTGVTLDGAHNKLIADTFSKWQTAHLPQGTIPGDMLLMHELKGRSICKQHCWPLIQELLDLLAGKH